jgi:hypothetical protein
VGHRQQRRRVRPDAVPLLPDEALVGRQPPAQRVIQLVLLGPACGLGVVANEFADAAPDER